ncbi:nitrite reductase small subunit NirD [Effusibacillus pohliae]|uniref:nitrite reductase small subunit NirD n=1 Tax=Effusibacillus pohliae TaxID=232270 RepID=UPI00036AF227|nr:nitrite reductase small subunit NirD [Effusibacillus pohliae]
MKGVQAVRLQVATLQELTVQTGRVVKVDGREIALFRLSTGEVRAVENRCPHKGGPLAEGIVCGEYVFCPLHDWKICLRDGNVQAPDNGCVTTFQVDVVNEKVYISM